MDFLTKACECPSGFAFVLVAYLKRKQKIAGMRNLILLGLFLSLPAMVLATADTARVLIDSSYNSNDTATMLPAKEPVMLKPEFRSTRGYRLQVLKTQNRTAMLKLKSKLLESLPGTRIYMTYQAPFYRLRVGNFLDRGDALQFRRRYLDSLANVFVVRDKVIYTWYPPGWKEGG